MRFLHYHVSAGPGDAIEVTLDGQANVLLMDSTNFSAFRLGRSHRYFGGWARTSPVRLAPPHHGAWNIVVHRGGQTGGVRVGVRVIQSAT